MESLNKSVLITGAGGFIGLNTVKMFSGRGWNIYALVHKNIPDYLREMSDVKIIQTNILDEKTLDKDLANINPDVVVHIAGLASDVGSDETFRKINFETVKYFAKIPKKKLIYISSTDVYGIKDFNGEDEEHIPFEENPLNPYPKYKIESEKWLRENLDKSRYVIIRPAAVWGEGDKTLENRAYEFLKVSPFIVHFGKWKGNNRWPLANVKNVAGVIYSCAMYDDFDGEAINIIDEKRTTIDEYYRQVGKKYFPDKKFKTITLPLWVGKLIGLISTFFSNLFKMKKPLFDPTYYAVHHVASNLDFSCSKMKIVLQKLDKDFQL